jgi:hypothetical protein
MGSRCRVMIGAVLFMHTDYSVPTNVQNIQILYKSMGYGGNIPIFQYSAFFRQRQTFCERRVYVTRVMHAYTRHTPSRERRHLHKNIRILE